MQEFMPHHENASQPDSWLAGYAHQGDRQAFSVLLFRYMPYIRKKAGQLVRFGCEYDDLLQEGMIGLMNAVRAYNPVKGVFQAFALKCISHKMLSAVKKMPAKADLSLDDCQLADDFGQEGQSLSDFIASPFAQDPEFTAIQNESVSCILQRIQSLLSKFECEVLILYLNGFSYEGIAAHLHHTTKAVDNALQRVRRKLKIALTK